MIVPDSQHYFHIASSSLWAQLQPIIQHKGLQAPNLLKDNGVENHQKRHFSPIILHVFKDNNLCNLNLTELNGPKRIYDHRTEPNIPK